LRLGLQRGSSTGSATGETENVKMANNNWCNRLIILAFFAYISFFSFKLLTLLYPTLFLVSNSLESKDKISPIWEEGTEVHMEIDLILSNNTKVPIKLTKEQSTYIHSSKNASEQKPMTNSTTVVILDLSGYPYQSLVFPKPAYLKFRFTAMPAKTAGDNPQPITIQAEVALIQFKSNTSKSSKAINTRKRHLVKGWPIVGDFFPRLMNGTNHNGQDIVPVYQQGNSKKIACLLPKVTVHFVADFTQWPKQHIPDHVKHALRMVKNHPDRYLPIMNTLQVGLKQNELIQINTTRNAFPPVQVEVGQIGFPKWGFYALIEESFSLHRSIGLIEESDMDDIRRLFTENQPEILLLTLIVSLFHMLFDTLAFKSEITFWRNIQRADGLSLRSMGLNLFSQIVVAFYLKEQEASALILFPTYVSVAIGLWKLVKAASLKRENLLANNGAIHVVRPVTDEEDADSTALKVMSLLLAPFVLGYSIFSLLRDDHVSWYSWVISSLASCVYAGGFALMTPQIFLNYKLKSVSHLDWSALWYRAFNTFIDDFFAYLIPMPGLARVAVFRDDIVFLTFLYQRWIYPSRKEKEE
jgi:hypothetical protein